MREKKYKIILSSEERKVLNDLIGAKVCSKEKRLRAYILLRADKACGWSDKKIKEAYDCSISKIERLRKRFVLEGFEIAIERKLRAYPPRAKKLDGEQEAHLIALCCSQSPEGRRRWTMELLAEHMVKLGYVNSVSKNTIQRTLKKMNLSLG